MADNATTTAASESKVKSLRLGVVILAAGYGTRLRRDLDAHPQLSRLKHPKPLLPISGKPILSHWIDSLNHPSISGITLITNALHLAEYAAWAASYPDRYITIVSNASTDNSNRRGAVADLHRALQHTPCDAALVLAGDTLLPGTDIDAIIDKCLTENTDPVAAVLAYELTDVADASKRGMLDVEETEKRIIAKRVVEKPSPENSPSKLATAPVYFLPRYAIDSVGEFLEVSKERPLEERDAPGHWLSWMVRTRRCEVKKVQKRVDIGNLQHYLDALWKHADGKRHKDEPAVGRAFPRVGMLGNPSDGYGGAVIAFTIASEGYAEVIATESEKFRIIPNPDLEVSVEWDNVDGIVTEVHERGLDFSARKLVIAAVAVFSEIYKKKSNGTLPNCELSYSTTIPPRIGLAGSSALVLATFRALARFCSTTLVDIESDFRVWPELMLKVEKEHLGIACGLMDRIVQVLQGCVLMVFDKEKWTYNRLSKRVPVPLPNMWLAYSKRGTGECSGNVHGELTKRFLKGDEKINEVVMELRELAFSGWKHCHDAIKYPGCEYEEYNDLGRLLDLNFEKRCKLIGVDRVGKENIRLVRVARRAGFFAKLTGSGGCALCLSTNWRQTNIEDARRQLEDAGFVLRRVEPLEELSQARPWKN